MKFDDVIGQEFAVKVLKHSIGSDAVSHAYLFAGLEGVGKTTTALAFAAALNCEHRAEDGDSCGECWSCRAITEARHPDVELIAPETEQTKIDQMREMRRRAMFPPIRSPWKVLVLERAETLNDDSASAILKILEEPPSYAVLLLLTRNMSLALSTIVSRCQVVRFRQSSADVLRAALQERFNIDEEKADFLSRYTEGRVGEAISLLEDEAFFARRDAILNLAQLAASAEKPLALRLAEEFRKSCAPSDKPKKKGKSAPAAGAEDDAEASAKSGRREIRQGLDSLVLWYRDLLSLALLGPDAPVINLDKREDLAKALPSVSRERTRSALASLTWAKRALAGNANPQLITEVVMMRILRG
ncbi:MAG: DNA polymerase III subunit delta' [Armatimonadota bacterium]|nr:DNA polymerase III subunit delta' [Armatimonadota bacterium]